MGDLSDNESGDSASLTEAATMKRVTKRKHGLFERLRIKLNRTSSATPEESAKSPQSQNAVKATKKVGIGLMKYDSKRGSYFQVRTKCGGGTGNVSVSKQATKVDLLCEAKSLFFPDGNSVKFGFDEDYHFDLMDYQFVTLQDSITVQQLSELTGLTNIRFYLAIKPKDLDIDTTAAMSTTGPPLTSASTAGHPLTSASTAGPPLTSASTAGHPLTSASTAGPPLTSASTAGPPLTSASTVGPPLTSASTAGHPLTSASTAGHPLTSASTAGPPLTLASTTSIPVSSAQDHPWTERDEMDHTASSNEDELPNILPIHANIDVIPDSFDILDDLIANFDQQQSEVRHHAIRLHRGHVFGELKTEFKKHGYDLDKDVFNFHMILPNGDLEVAEDNEFWDSFFDQCCLGNICKVPFIRHDYDHEEWQAIASVLYLGWKWQKYFPISLAKSFMSCCIFGLDTFGTTKESIIPEYLSFLPCSESEILKSALDGRFDEEELIDILSVHECRVLPTKENIKRLVGEIAHKEMIQQPMYVKGAWFEKFSLFHFNLSSISLEDMYDSLRPNPRKVVKMLSFPEDMSSHQKVTSDFLKKYVRELEKDSLGRFLRFCTGADLCLRDVTGVLKPIFVRFSSISGLARRPVAHTCGQVLELPNQYENFMDFRTEFNMTLESGVWVMDYV